MDPEIVYKIWYMPESVLLSTELVGNLEMLLKQDELI